MNVKELVYELLNHPLDSVVRIYLNGEVFKLDSELIRTEPMSVALRERCYGPYIRGNDREQESLTLLEIE